ncbi:MAG: hypothetical protein ACI4SC_04120 [Candidatus Neoclostridium sp.]
MSKYDALWAWIGQNGADSFFLTFDEIEKIVGFPVDHSFLTSKKELTNYGYQAVKISLKDRFIMFEKSV